MYITTSGFSCSFKVCWSTYLLLSGTTSQGSIGQGSSPGCKSPLSVSKSIISVKHQTNKDSEYKHEQNLRNMITRSRNNGSPKSWPTWNLLPLLTVFTYQGNISGLCLSPGGSNSNPRDFNKFRYVLSLWKEKNIMIPTNSTLHNNKIPVFQPKAS